MDLCLKKHIGAMIVVLFSVALCFYLFGGDNFDINYALNNQGGDGTSFMSEVKMFLDSGSGLLSYNLGGTLGTDRRGTLSYYLDNDIRVLAYSFAKITGNVELAVNLTYIVSFFLNGLACYFVLVERKINPTIAAAGSVLFETQYYIFGRSTEHLMLTMVYTIPLGMLLCFWIGDDNEYLCFNKNFWRNKKNIITILISFMIVCSGIGYYMFFNCLVIIITGIGKAIKQNKFLPVIQAFKIEFLIIISLMIILFPYFYYKYIDGISGINNIRSMADAEIYNLKIFRLFVPPTLPNFAGLNEKLQEFNSVAVCQTETTDYLGLIGVLGIIIMAIVLIRNNKVDNEIKDVRLVSFLALFCILYATIGGVGTIVYVFVTDMARCMNRISVIIYFCCIFVCCYCADKFLKIITKKKRKTIGLIMLLFVFAACFKSQFFVERYDNTSAREMHVEMEEFVDSIEQMENDNVLVYQLPFQNYPSGPFRNNMYPNAHLMPYLYSNSIRWSYGSFIGEESYAINEKIANTSDEDFIEELVANGYGGIYIDTFAYTQEELINLEELLKKNNIQISIKSKSGRWLYCSL